MIQAGRSTGPGLIKVRSGRLSQSPRFSRRPVGRRTRGSQSQPLSMSNSSSIGVPDGVADEGGTRECPSMSQSMSLSLSATRPNPTSTTITEKRVAFHPRRRSRSREPRHRQRSRLRHRRSLGPSSRSRTHCPARPVGQGPRKAAGICQKNVGKGQGWVPGSLSRSGHLRSITPAADRSRQQARQIFAEHALEKILCHVYNRAGSEGFVGPDLTRGCSPCQASGLRESEDRPKLTPRGDVPAPRFFSDRASSRPRYFRSD